MKAIGFCAGLLFFVAAGCGGSAECIPNASTYCYEGVTYWADSCGNLESVMEFCQAGCKEDHSGCAEVCTPDCTGRCCGGDGCGGTCADQCRLTGQVCNVNTCSCDGFCTGMTCLQLGKECDSWNDGCGKQIYCGTCPTGEYCNAGTCVTTCIPKTCTSLGKECGSWADGCGAQLNCGDCATGTYCNDGACEATCTPKTCTELGKECGSWADGCGTQLDCGGCQTGYTCNASGACEVSTTLPRFSFFVTSLAAIRALSGSQDGFGGDLRYGETGDGAGLRGADKICAAIAERSMPGSSAKQWRAFLCTSSENAIDRIGNGPWYDRLGRLFANNKSELTYDRPLNADTAIKNDFPNEDGVPNHRPDPTQPQVDNHDMITGCNDQGRLYSSTANCLDWTSALGNRTVEGRPRVGHSWPRSGGGGGGGGDMENWISALDESGCAPGVNLIETGGPGNDGTIGSGGGYGGFYCFALTE